MPELDMKTGNVINTPINKGVKLVCIIRNLSRCGVTTFLLSLSMPFVEICMSYPIQCSYNHAVGLYMCYYCSSRVTGYSWQTVTCH